MFTPFFSNYDTQRDRTFSQLTKDVHLNKIIGSIIIEFEIGFIENCLLWLIDLLTFDLP